MRGRPLLVAMLLVASLTSCATRVEVDAREDLAPYHSWRWLPRVLPKVRAPHREGSALEADLARLIERELAGRGYQRIEGDPDFFVVYQLALRQLTVMVEQPQATYELSSHTSDGAFRIEGSEKVPRLYEHLELAVGVTDARGRTLWHARLTQQQENRIDLDLEAAVGSLLERFPRHRPPEAD